MKPKKRKKFINALQIPAYSKFVDARDRALEHMLINGQRRQTEVARYMFNALAHTAIMYMVRSDARGHSDIKGLTNNLLHTADSFAQDFIKISRTVKRRAYILSYLGEAEAIGKATRQTTQYNIDHTKIMKAEALKSQDGDELPRVKMYLHRLVSRIVNAIQQSSLKKETPDLALARIVRILPKPKPSPKKVLSKIKEAKKPFDSFNDAVQDEAQDKIPEDVALGFVSEEEWKDIVADYRDDYIPSTRGGDTSFDLLPDDGPDKVYGWEVEKDTTEDFVKAVRTGQMDSANENGITDFVWIAIVDDHTDDCCLWRDGMLTSEIEKALDSGNHQDDECDAIAPPAHFNCRCRIAPALDSIRDTNNETDDSDVSSDDQGKDFDTWMES